MGSDAMFLLSLLSSFLSNFLFSSRTKINSLMLIRLSFNHITHSTTIQSKSQHQPMWKTVMGLGHFSNTSTLVLRVACSRTDELSCICLFSSVLHKQVNLALLLHSIWKINYIQPAPYAQEISTYDRGRMLTILLVCNMQRVSFSNQPTIQVSFVKCTSINRGFRISKVKYS